MKNRTNQKITGNQLFKPFILAGLLVTLATPSVFAASQTWTNAPVTAEWTNVLNWAGQAVPGALGITGGTQNGDFVTFSNALSGGIGGSGNPIVNDANREVRGFVFDTPDCGAYVIGNAASNLLWLSATVLPGGSIVVNPAVTNPIVFMAESHFRLQSSQNGGYSITNNATSPNATLYFDVLWPDSASSRPLTLTLAGSNTGTNTIRHIDDNAGANGSIHLIKSDAGRWILSGANDIPQKKSGGDNINGSIAVIGGTLEVMDPGSLGAITVANLTITNGVLQIDGITPNNNGFTLRQNGTIQMNGSGTVNGVTMANTPGNSATLATTSASDVMTIGDGSVANQMTGGAADSVLYVTGPGTVLLSQPGNYAGKWSVDAGTNQIAVQGALGTGANLNIGAGGVFDVTPLGASAYTLDTKALSASGTGSTVGSTAATILMDPAGTVDFVSKPITLTFTPTSFTGDSGHPALFAASGTLSFHGNSVTVNNASGTPLGAGTYLLVHQASGSVVSSGGFVALVTGSGLGAGLIPEIVATGGNLNLVVSAYTPKNLVWTGGDSTLPDTWDRQTSINWLAGASPVTFNIYDVVAFNATGSAHPNVNLAATMAPGSVTVDTSANNYTFSGVGQIAGGTSLVKINTGGTLILQTANTYSGGTIISNGVVQLGIDEGVSSTGAGDLVIYNPGVFDLNNFSNDVNALIGNGTVDITGGNVSTLIFGNNGDSGTFSGVIQNTSGALGLFKSGNGTETLTASNSYVGPTIIDTGTLRVTNTYALGAGNSPVTINNGTLDMDTSLLITNLNGAGGTVVNSSATTNTLTILGDSTYGGVISGKTGVLVNAGTLRLNGVNTYSNGTIVASGAGLAIGGGAANPGPGGVIASNNVTISQPNTASGSSTFAPPVTTVDGATVTFVSSTTANNWGNQFIGSALATNIFANGNMSIGGTYSFSNFLGTVIITNGGVRMGPNTGLMGGDNATFDFINGGGLFTRDAGIVRLGALSGNGAITGPSVGTSGTFWIGAKGIDSEFSGTITGSNNIVKVGAGRLTLDGSATTIYTDGATYTNYLYASGLTYLNSTTISNGVLALSVPNDLSYSPTIMLATSNAVLDASNMGYVTNFNDINFNPDSALVTNGVFQVVAFTPTMGTPQTLGGFGAIKGNGVVNFGTIDPGNATAGGTLSISNGLAINAGAIDNFDLSDDLTGLIKPSDMILVQGDVTLSGGSTISIGALNGVLAVGKYPLIKYSGHLVNESGIVPPGPVSNFTLGGIFPATSRATLVISNAPGEVDLIVVSLNNLNMTWAGDGVSNWWDVVNSYNWTNNAGPIQFYQLDNVTFDNTATNLTAFLQGTVVPGSILVNSSSNYFFGGPGNIGGVGTLTKTGTGSLTLTNGANSYTGGTVLSNGVLKVGAESGGNENDLALGTGPVTINSPAELRFGGNSGAVVNHFITNAIVVNGGLVKAADGVQHLTNSTVTVNAGGGTFETVFSTKNLVLDSPLIGTGNLTVASGTNIAGGQVILTNPKNTINGSVIIATNGNLTLVSSAGISNSPSIDVQLGGILDVSTRTNTANTNTLTLQSGQTLQGNGLIRGSVIAAAGSILSPGESAIGTLTLTNALTLAGLTTMEINRAGAPNNSDRIAATNIIAGGTLTVVNLGAAPQANDTFQLFNKAVTGAFAVTNLPTLSTGLIWNNSLAVNGTLKVVATISTSPTNIVASLNGTNLTLSWPLDHTGWRLLMQTNKLSQGVSSNTNDWGTVTGSAATNQMILPINPANPTEFYRMVYP